MTKVEAIQLAKISGKIDKQVAALREAQDVLRKRGLIVNDLEKIELSLKKLSEEVFISAESKKFDL